MKLVPNVAAVQLAIRHDRIAPSGEGMNGLSCLALGAAITLAHASQVRTFLRRSGGFQTLSSLLITSSDAHPCRDPHPGAGALFCLARVRARASTRASCQPSFGEHRDIARGRSTRGRGARCAPGASKTGLSGDARAARRVQGFARGRPVLECAARNRPAIAFSSVRDGARSSSRHGGSAASRLHMVLEPRWKPSASSIS